MNRLNVVSVDEATGHTAEVFASIKRAFGAVPNAFLVAGTNSPLALEAALALDGALHKGSLSVKEIEVIKLAVSQTSGCDYCLAAHTVIGKGAGLKNDEILAARHSTSSGNIKFDALSKFARTLVSTSGTISADTVNTVKHAGYSDQQIMDILLAVTSITFTNLINRVNDTPLDFPAVS
ncbi:carboxymuconolactone decarboxylase family protein [Pseudomonas sp. B14-6]|uniref:carboxymuconolactone decarboxylase family protein n=1 Tax=Pseudomonas sp. B14-6 TaxID=2738843 RepID=UPI00155ED787|nr:carboxymuconolactone decarboxylase family protein [Pseudomonas sp. B14-6]QKG67105.1 carboxymuconolactone decarboxylase family protein [Pseudomonas sp. B14-6]